LPRARRRVADPAAGTRTSLDSGFAGIRVPGARFKTQISPEPVTPNPQPGG